MNTFGTGYVPSSFFKATVCIDIGAMPDAELDTVVDRRFAVGIRGNLHFKGVRRLDCRLDFVTGHQVALG